MAQAYIVNILRTAGGRRGGRLKDFHPADLGAASINGLLDRTGIDPNCVDDVIFGCVSYEASRVEIVEGFGEIG